MRARLHAPTCMRVRTGDLILPVIPPIPLKAAQQRAAAEPMAATLRRPLDREQRVDQTAQPGTAHPSIARESGAPRILRYAATTSLPPARTRPSAHTSGTRVLLRTHANTCGALPLAANSHLHVPMHTLPEETQPLTAEELRHRKHERHGRDGQRRER